MATVLLIIFVVLVGAIGAAVGSFLNVVIWRVPENMSLTSPPSHCPKCNSPVRWFDNVPVFSWFILRGRCRDCKEPISFRYPLVETLGCVVALIVAWGFLLGNWTGWKSQPFFWENYVVWTNAYNEEMERLAESAGDFDSFNGGKIFDSVVSNDNFLRLLRSTTILAIMLTLVVDLALILGFVEWDRGVSPLSLQYAALITLAIFMFVCFMINDFSNGINCCYRFIACLLLGGIGAGILSPLFCKELRFEQIVLGAVWGVLSGHVLALPGALVISLISIPVNAYCKKQTLGLCYFAGMVALLLLEVCGVGRNWID